jgi:glycosyltransferase involved in cell wall biosynthesis
VLGAVINHPLRELGDLARIARSLGRRPESFAKSLVVWWRALGLAPVVKAMAPTHVHAHFATYPSTCAWLLARRLKLPFSFTAHAHDIFLEDHLLDEKMRAAAPVVVISDFNRRFLQERVRAAGSADVRIIHCGVRLDQFPFVATGRDARRIVAVGRLDHIKGFEYLVEACALLKKRNVDFRCDVIGTGPLEADLAERIRDKGLSGQVLLLGARKQEEVRAMLNAAGVFALPSVVTERGDRDGIPVALMEAMASGLPVVSTRVSGIPELIEHEVTGLLAPERDAAALAACLERVLQDPAYGAALARQARAHIEREFDVERETRKLHAAIARAA